MSSQFVSGGSDLFYLFIFAIWLRRDIEHKREKSRCAQLLTAALAARDLVLSSAPGTAELDPSPRSQLGDTLELQHGRCWLYNGLVAVATGTPG